MIKLTKEYGIITKLESGLSFRLRHLCTKVAKRGYPISEEDYFCHLCKTPVDEKIQFMYKLWKWQNG